MERRIRALRWSDSFFAPGEVGDAGTENVSSLLASHCLRSRSERWLPRNFAKRIAARAELGDARDSKSRGPAAHCMGRDGPPWFDQSQ